MAVKVEQRPITLLTKWGSSAVVDNRFGKAEPRMAKLRPNALLMARIVRDEGGRLVIVTSGARLLGKGALQKDKSYVDYVRSRERDIHEEFNGEAEELERQLKAFRDAQIRHEHRVGQDRLMGILGHELGREGVILNEELLDGTEQDFTEATLAAEARGEAIAYNGHGSWDPYSRSRDNDVNLYDAVKWVVPNDPNRRLTVVTVTHPDTPGLMNSSHRLIRVHRTGRIPELKGRNHTVSTGGIVSKTQINDRIKAEFPHASVRISGMAGDVIENALAGKGGTLFELRHPRRGRIEGSIAS